MGLSRLEQETIIKFNAEEEGIEIYTAYPPIMRKLSASPDYTLVKEYKQDGEVVAMDFKAARNMITIRSKKPAKREMTEEEKQIARERLAKMRSKKSLPTNQSEN
jgi:hypothetical protein